MGGGRGTNVEAQRKIQLSWNIWSFISQGLEFSQSRLSGPQPCGREVTQCRLQRNRLSRREIGKGEKRSIKPSYGICLIMAHLNSIWWDLESPERLCPWLWVPGVSWGEAPPTEGGTIPSCHSKLQRGKRAMSTSIQHYLLPDWESNQPSTAVTPSTVSQFSGYSIKNSKKRSWDWTLTLLLLSRRETKRKEFTFQGFLREESYDDIRSWGEYSDPWWFFA